MSFELDALITKEVETLDIERESDLTVSIFFSL